jgi:hypothetical protein
METVIREIAGGHGDVSLRSEMRDNAAEEVSLNQTIQRRMVFISEAPMAISATKIFGEFWDSEPATLAQVLADTKQHSKGREDGILILRDGLVPKVKGEYEKEVRYSGDLVSVTLTRLPDSRCRNGSALIFVSEEAAKNKGEYVIAQMGEKGGLSIYAAASDDVAHLASVKKATDAIEVRSRLRK